LTLATTVTVTVTEGIIEIVGAGDGTAVGEVAATGEDVGVGSSMTGVGVSVGAAVGVAWPQLITITVARANRMPLTNKLIDFKRLSFLFISRWGVCGAVRTRGALQLSFVYLLL
jgi:hypothetical protein